MSSVTVVTNICKLALTGCVVIHVAHKVNKDHLYHIRHYPEYPDMWTIMSGQKDTTTKSESSDPQ